MASDQARSPPVRASTYLSITIPPPDPGLPPAVPQPSHRHAAPSAPWPWLDLDSRVEPTQVDGSSQPKWECPHPRGECVDCWRRYPQSLYPNWTPEQQKRSKVSKLLAKRDSKEQCLVYRLDVSIYGMFHPLETLVVNEETQDPVWKLMQQRRPENTRVRALFLENMTGPALQMLGTRYNIEPFFYSSSINWIPSRYQEEMRPKEGDHITFTLTFISVKPSPETAPLTATAPSVHRVTTGIDEAEDTENNALGDIIDTQSPLSLRSSNLMLLHDLLAVHMVRSTSGSTLISYHPSKTWKTTTAEQLYKRVLFAGRSVYWQNTFSKSADPTCLLLALLWHALYSWDEAMEELYKHICWMEGRVMQTSDLHMTQDLHTIRAHLLHYEGLLSDFRKTVLFVQKTPNPGMDDPERAARQGVDLSNELLTLECRTLLSEIERLQHSRSMQDKRLKNVMNLVFSLTNIEDSQQMGKMTEAAVRDSAAMKQIAYLTMVFLPASFVATVFGMNVRELSPDTTGTLPHYFAAAFPMTAVTVWIIIAFQFRSMTHREVNNMDPRAARKRQAPSMLRGLGWPVILMHRWMEERGKRK
ncbi:hypothetical protein HGRIS_014393 [Hohenbuehelia grisea]|uniref:Uncharacterized protein n=1 Tax=Hohenbuehelia grisea TaxID=104357 RepID=A0ABR3JV83_9AGAR